MYDDFKYLKEYTKYKKVRRDYQYWRKCDEKRKQSCYTCIRPND